MEGTGGVLDVDTYKTFWRRLWGLNLPKKISLLPREFVVISSLEKQICIIGKSLIKIGVKLAIWGKKLVVMFFGSVGKNKKCRV